MSNPVHLFLKANGEDVAGYSSISSLDRENSIECFSFEYGVDSASEAFTGEAAGRRNYEPIRINKRVDNASPRLWQALCENHVVEGQFKFYRPNPVGDGTTEHFYTVQISEARISGIELTSPDAMTGGSTEPPTEIISFTYNNMMQQYEDGGVSFEDNWRDQG